MFALAFLVLAGVATALGLFLALRWRVEAGSSIERLYAAYVVCLCIGALAGISYRILTVLP